MSVEFINKPTMYALIAHTRGDDLMASTQIIVAVSRDHERLERLRNDRAKEREEWLATHAVPYWQQCSIISREEIKEVPVA